MNVLEEKIKIDFRSDEPIYLQIARQIQALVTQGDLKQGDQLPTVRELATELRINFNTVSRAYRILDEAELISTQRGRGTYIWAKPSDDLSGLLRHQSLQGLTERFLAEAIRLGFTPEEIEQMVQEELHKGYSSKDPPGEQEGLKTGTKPR